MMFRVAGLWLHPDSRWAAAVVYMGLLVLMLTQVSRRGGWCRYLRAGDRGSALITLGILAVLALSGWVAWAT